MVFNSNFGFVCLFMDELSAFKGANPVLFELLEELSIGHTNIRHCRYTDRHVFDMANL